MFTCDPSLLTICLLTEPLSVAIFSPLMVTILLADSLSGNGIALRVSSEDGDAPSAVEGADLWDDAVDGVVGCTLRGETCCCEAKTIAGTPTPARTPIPMILTRFRGDSERDVNCPTILRARRWGFDRMRFCFW